MTFNLYPIGPGQPHCPQPSFKGQSSFKPQALPLVTVFLGLLFALLHKVEIMPSIPRAFEDQKQHIDHMRAGSTPVKGLWGLCV